ncbi:hypothetical protein ACFQ0K_08225 [Nocardioides caeni]|uniref:Uncharacterized protein n=1 Tax=Nocardioides caeni TaxID=574700 RepID=A0A4S8N3J5_9ACTN|nr:hypothetical protein [Nocardioides caeni]THV10112.1 hypothetical protein E9934_14975 [Nocardioides caeni]
MSTRSEGPDADLSAAIEAGFAGHGEPPAPLPGAYVAAGRRHLRRRRLATGGGALGVAAVIATIALLGSGGTPQGAPDRTPVVDSPSAEEDSTAAAKPVDDPATRVREWLSPGQVLGYDGEGRLVVRPGWEVVRRVDNPLERTAPAGSLGAVVTNGEKTFWYLLDFDADSNGASWDPVGKAYARLEDWLTSQVDLARSSESEQGDDDSQEGQAVWVEFEPGTDRLIGVNGARIVDQRLDPAIPGFAEPGERTAAAEVVRDGRTWFVLVRPGPVFSDNVLVDPAVLAEPTMAALLDHARRQYASGEGLR